MDSLVKDQFIKALLHMKKVFSLLLTSHEMNFGEHTFLKKILDGEDVSNMKEKLHISKPAISQMLNSLEKKGYIVRNIDEEDRRKISIKVTNEGKKVLEGSKKYFDDIIDDIGNRFGEDNINELTKLFLRLTDIIEKVKEGDLHE